MEPLFALVVGFLCTLALLAAERFQAEPGRPWITPNLLTDAVMGLIRLAIIAGLLGGAIVAAQKLVQVHCSFLALDLLDGQPGWVQLVTYFAAMDFAYYVFHRVMHSTKTLWVFHAVHHSQARANPLMATRSHVIEEVIYIVSRLLPPVVLGGSPPAVFSFIIIDQFWSYFVHSDIKCNLGPLKYVLVTPQYHRIHHSLELRHFDKNFAGRLIVWDYLFGTLHPRFDEYPEIGIANYPVLEESRSPVKVAGYVWGNLAYPFVALWHHFFKPGAIASGSAENESGSKAILHAESVSS